ncbi:MAG: N-acetyltransferase [Egibacteraceae bacterium]
MAGDGAPRDAPATDAVNRPSGPPPLLVRREAPGGTAASAAVHARAFPTPEGAQAPAEAVLLERLRMSDSWLPHLSLVAATATGEVIGHAVCTRARVADHPVLALGPVAVVPDLQGRGVGSALMHALLGAAEACDEPLVGVLGEPAYYGRFGFVPGLDVGVEAPDPGWAEYFQVRTLSAHTPELRGRFRYPLPFDDL